MLEYTLHIMLELLQPGHFPRHLPRLLQLLQLVSADCRLLQQTDVLYSLTGYLTPLVLLLILLCASFSWIGVFLGLWKRKGGCCRLLEWSGINKSCSSLTIADKSWRKAKTKTEERQLPEKVSESSQKTTKVFRKRQKLGLCISLFWSLRRIYQQSPTRQAAFHTCNRSCQDPGFKHP
jgi:hypothetical protein